MKRIVSNISVLLLAIFGLVSCNIKEDMSDCPGSMILDYSAYSDEILDDIEDDEQIDVFIFDPKSDVCIDRRTFTYGDLRKQGMEFKLPITYRNYNAVVWQGLNSPNYECHTMALGKTYQEFSVEIETVASSYFGEPDPLWATKLEPIEYCAKITRHRVYMTRIHTEVNLTLQERLKDGSIVDLDIKNFSVKIVAPNNKYRTGRSLCGDCEPYTNYNNGDDLGTLRLTPDMDCFLTVEGVDRSLDLVKYMLDTKTDDSISDQLFLDLNKVWNISLIVKETYAGYVAVGISVNGWVTWFSEGGLS